MMISRNCGLIPALTGEFTEMMEDIAVESRRAKEIYPADKKKQEGTDNALA